MLGYFILMGVAGFGVFFLAHNNGETLEGLIFLRIVTCRPIWTKLRGLRAGGGAGAQRANEGFVGNGGKWRCSSRQRRKPWEASSARNKTNKWAQRFKECGTMKADGRAETGLSLRGPGSMSQPGAALKTWPTCPVISLKLRHLILPLWLLLLLSAPRSP